MSQRLYNRFRMQMATRACMHKFQSLWQTNEHIAETMAYIEPRLQKAQQLFDARVGTDTEGYTVVKNQLLDSICLRAWLMAKRLTVFARKTGLRVLQVEMDHPLSFFERGPELERIARCATVTDRAERYLPQLDVYKIRMADVAALNADIEAVRPLSSERDAIGDVQQQLTASLPRLLQEVQDKLYELDDEVSAFMDEYPDYQDTYFTSRKIADLRARGKEHAE